MASTRAGVPRFLPPDPRVEEPYLLTPRMALRVAALGMVVSICLALIAMHFSDAYVKRLVREMLRVEGEYLSERYAETGHVPHPRTRVYVCLARAFQSARSSLM